MVKIKKKWIIQFFTDNDLYKFTMMMIAFFFFPNLTVRYIFVNRSKAPMPKGMVKELQRQVNHMGTLKMRKDEEEHMRSIWFLTRAFIDFLVNFRYHPEDVKITQDAEGYMHIEIEGPWYRTILWEVPLLAMIEELYFRMSNQEPDMELFRNRLIAKVDKLIAAGIKWAEFGTRRRFSFEIQEAVVAYCALHAPNNFVGTSNVYLAMKYKVRPIGTNAHEYYQAMMGIFGIRSANRMALHYWAQAFSGKLGHALPDTFTTDAFLRDFTVEQAKLYDGLRQDSGNPFDEGEKYIAHWIECKIDPKKKEIIFSDNLDVDKAIALHNHFIDRTGVSFGIGTHFTNDVGVKPLSIVIKMCAVRDDTRMHPRWVEVIKLSNDPGKHLGSDQAIECAKYELGILDEAA